MSAYVGQLGEQLYKAMNKKDGEYILSSQAPLHYNANQLLCPRCLVDCWRSRRTQTKISSWRAGYSPQ